MNKSVIITGITGQIGSYLADFYLEKGFKIYGLLRRTSSIKLNNADHLAHNPDVHFIEGDLADLSSLLRLCKEARADYVINAAAQSHVHTSFNEPINTSLITGIGALNMLEAVRLSGFHSRFIQLGTSETFGGIPETAPQNEDTVKKPKSPYGVAKLYAQEMIRVYRESYKMFACNAICFNNESPRRGSNFVTRKITLAVANIDAGKQDVLYLGNLEAKRDWSHTLDIVKGINLMLNHKEAEDFVFGSGETHTIREFCEIAFNAVALDYEDFVKTDIAFFRPLEVDILQADSSKAKKVLGWKPEISFKDLVIDMVEHDKQLV